MLDANILCELALDPRGVLARHIVEVGSDANGISIVAAAKLRIGCARKGSRALSAQMDAIPGSIEALAQEPTPDVKNGDIRAGLEATGKPIGPSALPAAARASGTRRRW
ncbi:MAG: VapC toxin family PIN domain ribonuclease [Albidovulum sp.]|nr:VapC toxin family PIN domain ribonuclease [Albidovulum sp.]